MLWEAFLLFSPIRMSEGQYQGRNSEKRVNAPNWNWPLGERNRLKSGRRSCEAVADAFDAVKRDAAHGGEAGDGGGFHVDEGGVVGGRRGGAFRYRSATLGLVASQSFPAPASQLKRSPVRTSMTPATLWAVPGAISGRSAPAQPMEKTRSMGPPSSMAAKARVAADWPAPAQAAIHSSSSVRCAQKRVPSRVRVGPVADERLELAGQGGDDGDAGHDCSGASLRGFGRRVAVGAEPVDGGAHGGVDGHDAEAELLLGAGAGGVHLLAAHADFFERGAGLFAADAAGDQLLEEGVGGGDGKGNLDGGRRDAGDGRHLVEDLLEGEVFAAEDVAAAGSALGERENVGAGDFGDIDEVQAGVDVGGKFAVEEVDEDAAGGRGLAVVGADGGGGVENDDLLAVLAAAMASCSARNLERL